MMYNNKKLKGENMNDVICVKITNGEEIIGKLESENTSYITLKDPRTIRFHRVNNGQIVAMMEPVSVSNQDLEEISIYQSSICAKFNVSKMVEKEYIENTSGIQVVSSILNE